MIDTSVQNVKIQIGPARGNWLAIVGALFTLAAFLPRVQAWDTSHLAPEDVLRKQGTLALTDGSSFFVFAKDGSFHSFPAGLSGRSLDGKWVVTDHDPAVFTVEAHLSWVNGISSASEYRRIVFAVYRGHNRPSDLKSFAGQAPKEVWDGYFLIEELVKIPKPAK
jgi:hypothetical protein